VGQASDNLEEWYVMNSKLDLAQFSSSSSSSSTHTTQNQTITIELCCCLHAQLQNHQTAIKQRAENGQSHPTLAPSTLMLL